MSKKITLQNLALSFLSIYKYVINTTRIWLSLFIIVHKGNLLPIGAYLENIKFIEESQILLELISKIYNFSNTSVIIFCAAMLSLSIFEIVFITGIINKKRWGVLGLIITSFFWLPLEIILILKFFTLTKISYFAINLLIILFLIKLLKKRRKSKSL
ncbi:MAG: DUF2127 domain-containing protein [Nanoarchaeota archaeon]